jgi:hypothetical protein
VPREALDFYARPPYQQEFILCSMTVCCRHWLPTEVKEYIDGECKHIARQRRRDLSDMG